MTENEPLKRDAELDQMLADAMPSILGAAEKYHFPPEVMARMPVAVEAFVATLFNEPEGRSLVNLDYLRGRQDALGELHHLITKRGDQAVLDADTGDALDPAELERSPPSLDR